MTAKSIKKPKVFVGLSGGVDSSVAALRLKRQGYDVVGVFIKVWQPDFLRCNAEAERLDAMRAAAALDIPFLTCDAAEAYKTSVGDYFVAEYLAGRTPNPDVVCNRHVKFGVFWEFAKARGADFIATGHYARVEEAAREESPFDSSRSLGAPAKPSHREFADSLNDDSHRAAGHYRLLRGVDTEKDQSYFLWMLTEDDLAHTLFPVGDSTKATIRAEAARAGLPTAAKKDSQGICFLGHVDIPEFMSHFTTLVPGPIFDVRGEIIGEHAGALVYTLGQRHGLTIFGASALQPHFVVGKDIASNSLIVDDRPPVATAESEFRLEQLNWISGQPAGLELQAAFRYRSQPVAVTLSGTAGVDRLHLAKSADKPASGQSVVFYDGEVCLGGAVIQ